MKSRLIFTVKFLFVFILSFAQEKDKMLAKGDKLYNDYAYFNSVKVYEGVANKGYKSVELFEKLGNAYFFNALYPEANKWYTELFALDQEVESIYYYRYSQTLKTVGEFNKSNEYLMKFAKYNSQNSLSIQYAKDKNYLEEIGKKPIRYSIENLGINSVSSDYGASVYKDLLVFTSTRKPGKNTEKRDSWTTDYYSSLYSTILPKENKLSIVTPFSEEIQSEYHKSTPVFTKDGKTMYFTRSDHRRKDRSRGLDEKIQLRIVKATFENGKWGDVIDLPINSNNYSCGHPALGSNERSLFFSSDMPGGYGDSDIYIVNILGDNTYGRPENLGKNINTQGKETFPFVSDTDELYFASDGHLGLGGLDIFITNIKDKKYTNTVCNLGKPMNSPFDDFSFFKLDNSNIGFFASNREGGQGKDDLYSFIEQTEPENTLKLENLKIVDKETQNLIKEIVVTVYDSNHNILRTLKADKDGKYSIVIDNAKSSVVYVEAKSPEYGTQEITLDGSKDQMKNVQIELPKTLKNLTEGTDLAKLFLNDILFDLGKYSITKDSEVELQKVVEFMNSYPSIKISIRTHTDSRQSASANMELSEKRAKTIMNYLIDHGITRDRLSSTAYGESQLLNKCADGVVCTEAEHKVNRRCEFIILKM
jgi:outer membrane protein OmpA-like peptidoglycan-associated protein